MTHSLVVRPDMPLSSLLAALHRQRASEIALIFTLGAPTQLADAAALLQLANFSQHAEKEIVIIGGDERLRALAVAAGFVVATSLEDHKQRATRQPVRRHPHDTWENSYARFATRRTPRSSRPLPSDDELVLDEPPDYVRRLLEDLPALPVAYATPTASMQRSRRTTHKLPVVDDAELVRETYESDEDRVTKTIRTTSTVSQSAPAAHLSLLPHALRAIPLNGDQL